MGSRSKRDEPVRVLIGYVGKFDPTFSGKTDFPKEDPPSQVQLSDEGPIVSVLRYIKPHYVCLMYGSRHAQAGRAATEDKYYATISYLKRYLKDRTLEVFGYPISIDNPTDYRCLEPVIPDTLTKIQIDMQRKEGSNLEYHVVWSGTREIRDVLFACVVCRLIDAQVWYTKEPQALRPGESRIQAKDVLMYRAIGRQRVLQEALEEFDIVALRGSSRRTIEIIIKGRRFTDPERGGIPNDTRAALLVYELCKELSSPENISTGISKCKPALLKARLPQLGADINKYRGIINERYQSFARTKKDLILTTGRGKNSEWSLLFPPTRILVA